VTFLRCIGRGGDERHRGQKSEIGGRKTEMRGIEVRSQKSEIGGRGRKRAEGEKVRRRQKSEVRRQRSEVRNQMPESMELEIFGWIIKTRE